jgi:hypothetical protein
MKIKKFEDYIKENNDVHIEKDYANEELPNKVEHDDDTQYKNQGWFFYQKDLLNPQAKKPPVEGLYDVKAYYGVNAKTDVAEFKNGRFEKSKEYGLPDDQITHWKVRQTNDKVFKYNKETGKFKKKIKKY